MKEKILMDLGLSQNESKIYLTLLYHGAANPTVIAEHSGIHRVNVYDSLSKLKEKALVSEIAHSGKKQYQAAPPESLRTIIHEKEIKLQKILPELQMLDRVSLGTKNIQIYEGYDFIRNLFLHFLEVKEDIYAMDVPKYVVVNMGTYFQNVIHQRRAEQQQNMYHLYNKDAIERIKFLNTLPYTKARCLDNEISNNQLTLICGEDVSIHIFSEKDDQKPIAVLIKNRHVADNFRKNFWILWQHAIVPK